MKDSYNFQLVHQKIEKEEENEFWPFGNLWFSTSVMLYPTTRSCWWSRQLKMNGVLS